MIGVAVFAFAGQRGEGSRHAARREIARPSSRDEDVDAVRGSLVVHAAHGADVDAARGDAVVDQRSGGTTSARFERQAARIGGFVARRAAIGHELDACRARFERRIEIARQQLDAVDLRRLRIGRAGLEQDRAALGEVGELGIGVRRGRGRDGLRRRRFDRPVSRIWPVSQARPAAEFVAVEKSRQFACRRRRRRERVAAAPRPAWNVAMRPEQQAPRQSWCPARVRRCRSAAAIDIHAAVGSWRRGGNRRVFLAGLRDMAVMRRHMQVDRPARHAALRVDAARIEHERARRHGIGVHGHVLTGIHLGGCGAARQSEEDGGGGKRFVERHGLWLSLKASTVSGGESKRLALRTQLVLRPASFRSFWSCG